MMDQVTTLSADWIVPVTSPPIANGLVSYADGRVKYVGPADGRTIDQHFGRAMILPGLINAHTHLDLTGAAGQTSPRQPFPDWLRSVIAFRRQHLDVDTDLQLGARLCLEAGTTLIGDIAGTPAARQELSNIKLQRVVYWELLGLTPERSEQAILEWKAAGFPPVSPHAPFSFHKAGLATIASHQNLVAMHVAESLDERELLEHHAGPFVAFLGSMDVWHPEGLATSWSEVLQHLCSSSTLIVHGNYLDPNMAVSPHHTIVYCPRTHAAFGHAPHPFRQFLERGIRVVLGTDSLATNPDLSVLDEARFVAEMFPDVDLTTLLHMITDWPARALGQGQDCGSIAVGRRADFCIVEMQTTDDPLGSLFHERTPIQAVFIGGDRVV